MHNRNLKTATINKKISTNILVLFQKNLTEVKMFEFLHRWNFIFKMFRFFKRKPFSVFYDY